MSDSTPPQVKCADCGYLAVRTHESRTLVEADLELRKCGTSPKMSANPTQDYYDPLPLCFVMEQDLVDEFRRALGQTQQASNATRMENSKREWRTVFSVIEAPRTCPQWIKWCQGFTPREHKEMIDAQKQQEWNEKRLEADRQRAERREDATKKADRKFQVVMVLLSAAFTVLGWFIGSRKNAVEVKIPPPASHQNKAGANSPDEPSPKQ
jgi:hypothetical protein